MLKMTQVQEPPARSVFIQGAELPYEEADVIHFAEGLIGMPGLRRMVLVRETGVAPFLWLASLDDKEVAFLVVEPQQLFPDFRPQAPDSELFYGTGPGLRTLTLALTRVAPDWRETTVNLRAPLFINPATMRGAQFVLGDERYRLDEPLPREVLAD